MRAALKSAKGLGNFRNLFYYAPHGKKDGIQLIPVSEVAAKVDSVKQNGRFTDNYLGRSTGMIVGGYSAMVVAPSL